jgi:hypothetical protein
MRPQEKESLLCSAFAAAGPKFVYAGLALADSLV